MLFESLRSSEVGRYSLWKRRKRFEDSNGRSCHERWGQCHWRLYACEMSRRSRCQVVDDCCEELEEADDEALK
jgi:hypothetical protein